MFEPKKNVKHDPEQQWGLPDRIFFGFGACHILAGTFLNESSLHGFYAEWIDPNDGLSGTHVYVTNGLWSFDFHGYSLREQLLAKYWQGQRARQANWDAEIYRVGFSLLDTVELNKRAHKGPDQYFRDPIPRARRFILSKKVPDALTRALVR